MAPDSNPTLGIVLSTVTDAPVGEFVELAGLAEQHQVFAPLHPGVEDEADLAHFDSDGYVWFVGRKKLMIVRRGSNIAPAEIENVLDAHPQIHASVVVGVPDRLDGQVPVACVAAIDSLNPPQESELRAYVAQHLAAYKNPTRYLFLDELPRNSTGTTGQDEMY